MSDPVTVEVSLKVDVKIHPECAGLQQPGQIAMDQSQANKTMCWDCKSAIASAIREWIPMGWTRKKGRI